jgi:hypothetical protein
VSWEKSRKEEARQYKAGAKAESKAKQGRGEAK